MVDEHVQFSEIALGFVDGEQAHIAMETAREDSLAHLNLILALEEQYGVEFLPEEMEQIRTVSDIIAILQGKLGKEHTNVD